MAKRAQQQDARGRFVPGNTAALTHGGRSQRAGVDLMPELAAVLAEKRGEIVAQLGGDDAITPIRRELVDGLIRSSAIAEALFANVLQHGVLTGKGRSRAAVATFLQVLDRQVKIATALGLERRAKPLVSPLDYLKGKADVA